MRNCLKSAASNPNLDDVLRLGERARSTAFFRIWHKADMLEVGMDVCKVPETDIGSDFNQNVKATRGSVERLLKLSLEQK